jgi:benzil reductase ((S)-benzoin forming)
MSVPSVNIREVKNLENVIITGASHGIGNSLAHLMLNKGCRVFGISRSIPRDLLKHPHFHFCSVDLSDLPAATERLANFLLREHRIQHVWRLFLNAGLFSQRIAPMKNVPLADIDYLMKVNVWANKMLLDLLLGSSVTIDSCVVSSSIAGVRARSGFNGYAISKSALNMTMKLYALENPSIFFAVLGLCFVDTRLGRHVLNTPLEGDFPENLALRERAKNRGYLATAEQRALDVDAALSTTVREHITSGDFIEIRSLEPLLRNLKVS